MSIDFRPLVLDLKRRSYLIQISLASCALLIFLKFWNSALDEPSHCAYRTLNYTTQYHSRLNQNSSPESSPKLCVLTRIYGAQVEYFPAFVLSLRHSGLDDVRIYVINTDSRTNIQLLERAIKSVNAFVSQRNYITLLRLGEPPVASDYGYIMTDRALLFLYRQYEEYASQCQYLLITNSDNLYSRKLGKLILPQMKAKKDLIAWDFVSHHFQGYFQKCYTTKNLPSPEVIDYGTEKCMQVAFEVGRIDLGAAIYRFAFLHEHKLLFEQVNQPYKKESDGFFVVQASKLTNESVIVRHTLFFHQ